jgi:hypothetical protein
MVVEDQDYKKVHTLAEMLYGVSLTQVQMEYLFDTYPLLNIELYLDEDKDELEWLIGNLLNREVMEDECEWPQHDDDKLCKNTFYKAFVEGAKMRGYKLTGWWENPFPRRNKNVK